MSSPITCSEWDTVTRCTLWWCGELISAKCWHCWTIMVRNEDIRSDINLRSRSLSLSLVNLLQCTYSSPGGSVISSSSAYSEFTRPFLAFLRVGSVIPAHSVATLQEKSKRKIFKEKMVRKEKTSSHQLMTLKEHCKMKLNTVTHTHLLNSQYRDVRTGTSKVILEVKGTSNGEVTSWAHVSPC